MKKRYDKDLVALHTYLDCHNWEIVDANTLKKLDSAISCARRYCPGCGKLEWEQSWGDGLEWKEDGSCLARKHVIAVVEARMKTKDLFDYVI
jgi:hypothetical protein